MKKFLPLIYFSLFSFSSLGQGGIWTWISGADSLITFGVFGTLGVPSVNNHPPGITAPIHWTDKQGNFWLYGGYNLYADLWKYNPVTNEWTWVKTNNSFNQPPVYGTKGVGNPANTPGFRGDNVATWVDTSGGLWLFSGGDNSSDLWKYNIKTNEWTWVNGDTIPPYTIAIHGIEGVPSPSNIPGSRYQSNSTWTDSLNNLWLFGGYGWDDNGWIGYLNDLWKYDISGNEWTWMKGSAFADSQANYGIKGVLAITNVPGARETYTAWKDSKDNFWLMGGMDINQKSLNDLWKYDLGAGEWVWIGGANVSGDTGNYGPKCIYNINNTPYSRWGQSSSVTDNCGRFWMFGGINDNYGYLNDLWVYDPQQLEWNLVSGSNLTNQPGNFGNLGVPSPTNMPEGRMGGAAWWGNDNKFYFFGGYNDDDDMWVFNPDSSCIPSCYSLLPPNASFQSTKTVLCANDCVYFTNPDTRSKSWQWLFPGGSPSSSTNQNPQVCYLTSGIYNVTLVASNSGGSDTLNINNYITVNAAPPVPNVQDHPGIGNDTLVFSNDTNYTSYQWYLDSTLVTGATDTFLVVTKNGDYNVSVTNANGCKTAVGINVIIGLQNYVSDHLISLWPNPAGNKLTVDGLQFTVANIEIFNVLGEVVQRTPLFWRGVGGEADVSSLPSGIYFVQFTPLDGHPTGLIGERERWVGRFVKE